MRLTGLAVLYTAVAGFEGERGWSREWNRGEMRERSGRGEGESERWRNKEIEREERDRKRIKQGSVLLLSVPQLLIFNGTYA